MYTHSPDPSKQYAILRKIRGSRDQAIPGYFAPQEQIPWVRDCGLIRIQLPEKCKDNFDVSSEDPLSGRLYIISMVIYQWLYHGYMPVGKYFMYAYYKVPKMARGRDTICIFIC